MSPAATARVRSQDEAKPQRPRLAYVPGLDGLRALAVAAVLLYHHDPRLLPGGFLGVELFFVLSGYLITALLFFEWRAFGGLDLPGFWLRRARRLVPAMLVMLLASLAIGALFLRDQLAELRGDALAALAYLANWRLILEQRPYFASFGRPSLLLHLWSLAIEEQFYLFWPPLLALTLARLGRRGALAVALGLAAVSAALMAWHFSPDSDLSRVYYGTDTRAAGLLVGAALALAWPPRTLRALAGRRAEPWRDLLGLAALAALAAILLTTHEFTPRLYRGGFLLVDLAAAAAIVAVARPGAQLCRALLGAGPLRWVGLRSYSIYLWHWPVFVLTRPGLDVPLSGLPLLAVRLALTLALAELSFLLVEGPARRGAIGRAWATLLAARGSRRHRLAAGWATAAAASGALVGWLAFTPASGAATPTWAADLLLATTATTSPASIEPIPAQAALIVLPTVPALTPTKGPPPLPVTPVAGGAARLAIAATTREPIAPPLGRPAPASTGDPRLAPTVTPSPSPVRSVLAVGDSIMLGAAGAISAAMPQVEINAAVSRQIDATIALLRARRDAGQLADMVVVHVGNNGYVSPERAVELLDVLAGVPRVVVVNTAVPRSWEGPNNQSLAAAVPNYPNAVLVDWRAASAGRYELFWDDGVHLRPEGAALFAALIAEQVR